MSTCLTVNPFKSPVKQLQSFSIRCTQYRLQSTYSATRIIDSTATNTQQNEPIAQAPAKVSPLARLSTRSIVRSLFLSTFFTSPLLFTPGFTVFRAIANSKSSILNPDVNPILRACIRPIVYDQFCAGRNQAEIDRTAAEIKGLGFSGVVLCYGKEVQIDGQGRFVGYDESTIPTLEEEIAIWREGNINTLNMVGSRDWLGMKISGAGINITKALIENKPPPPVFIEAMEAISRHAESRGIRIWIDAEQQILQTAIDEWSIEFMRRFNKPGQKSLIYTTVQAYLKASREKLQYQLKLSQAEGWRLGVKLVRGAYISMDQREKIHDTKDNTDVSYNGIVKDALQMNFPALQGKTNPEFDLLLAGHNSHSVRTAAKLASDLAADSKLHVVPEFAQLQGMADDIGCELLQMSDDVKTQNTLAVANTFSPRVFKCLTWGSIQECMQYLTRRLVENRGAADRMREGAIDFRKELRRRFLSKFGLA